MDRGLPATRGLGTGDVRVVHWSPAEASSLDRPTTAPGAPPGTRWPDIPWFDSLGRVVREEPVTVRGAFGFGLKPIAKGMRAAGLIATTGRTARPTVSARWSARGGATRRPPGSGAMADLAHAGDRPLQRGRLPGDG